MSRSPSSGNDGGVAAGQGDCLSDGVDSPTNFSLATVEIAAGDAIPGPAAAYVHCVLDGGEFFIQGFETVVLFTGGHAGVLFRPVQGLRWKGQSIFNVHRDVDREAAGR